MTSSPVKKQRLRQVRGVTQNLPQPGPKSKIQVKLGRSPSGRTKGHLECLRGLGLRRLGSVRALDDTPSIRGMIQKVSLFA